MNSRDEARAVAVVGILDDWADWQQGYRIRVGYPPKSAGFSSGGSVSEESSEHDYSAIDRARFEIVDSCIDDLPCNQSAAIHRRYLSAVYRLRDYEGALLAAHDALCVAFVRKGIMY